MNNDNIHINKYISEEGNDKTTEVFSQYKVDTILDAPTGSGKSYFYGELVKRGMITKSALLVPYTIQVLSSVEESAKQNVHAFTGERYYDNFSNYDSYLTTLDSGIKYCNDVKELYVDEAHVILGQANFRPVMSELMSDERPKRFMTATPKYLTLLGLDDIVKVTKINTDTYNPIQLFETTARPSTIFKSILNRKLGGTKLIRHNNKARLDEWGAELKERGIKFGILYSKSDPNDISVDVTNSCLTDSEVEQLRKGVIPDGVEYILCTSVLDQGITLKNIKTPFRIFTIDSTGSLKDKSGNIIHGDNAIQLYNRNRSPKDTYMEIYGSFGTTRLDLKGDKDHCLHLERKKGFESAFDYAVDVYNENRKLDRKSWIEYIESYGFGIEERPFEEVELAKNADNLGKTELYTYCTNDEVKIKVNKKKVNLIDSKLSSYSYEVGFSELVDSTGLPSEFYASGTRELPPRYVASVTRYALNIYKLVNYEVPAEHYLNNKSTGISDAKVNKLIKFYDDINRESSIIKTIYDKYNAGENVRAEYESIKNKEAKQAVYYWLVNIEGKNKDNLNKKERPIKK